MMLKKNLTYKSTIIIVALITLSISACDTSKMNKTPIDNFIGTWSIEGRSMFKGIEIEIYKTDSGDLKGKTIKLNDNKYVKMFSELGDTWVSNIKRSSNFAFKLTEKKIGGALFSLYGQSTSKEHKVEFSDKNTIVKGKGGSVLYKRVQESNIN